MSVLPLGLALGVPPITPPTGTVTILLGTPPYSVYQANNGAASCEKCGCSSCGCSVPTYTPGSTSPALVLEAKDKNGLWLDLTGYTLTSLLEKLPTQSPSVAIIPAPLATVTTSPEFGQVIAITWQTNSLATKGTYQLTLTASNGTTTVPLKPFKVAVA